jgi:hypothetical protein
MENTRANEASQARIDKLFGRASNNTTPWLDTYDARMAKRTPRQIRRAEREYKQQAFGNDNLSFGQEEN